MAEFGTSETARSPKRVGMREFRANLSAYLRQVRDGASFLLVSRDVVLAEIRPPTMVERPPRQPGAM